MAGYRVGFVRSIRYRFWGLTLAAGIPLTPSPSPALGRGEPKLIEFVSSICCGLKRHVASRPERSGRLGAIWTVAVPRKSMFCLLAYLAVPRVGSGAVRTIKFPIKDIPT